MKETSINQIRRSKNIRSKEKGRRKGNLTFKSSSQIDACIIYTIVSSNLPLMGFIEAMLHPKFLLKVLLKEGSKSPRNCRKKCINNQKFAESRGPDTGTVVHQRMAARAQAHGCSCTNARPCSRCTGARESRHGRPGACFAGYACSASGAQQCTAIAHPCLAMFSFAFLSLMFGASSNL